METPEQYTKTPEEILIQEIARLNEVVESHANTISLRNKEIKRLREALNEANTIIDCFADEALIAEFIQLRTTGKALPWQEQALSAIEKSKPKIEKLLSKNH